MEDEALTEENLKGVAVVVLKERAEIGLENDGRW